MEKIKERKLLWLWLPQVLFVPALGLALLFALIFVPLGAIFLLGGVGLLVFAQFYRIYFYYQLSLDVNAVCKGDGIETKSYLYVLALNTVTFGIYGLYWVYKTAQRLQANAPRYGFKMIVGGKEMLVLDLFSNGWISAWEFIRNMNRIAKVYNQEIAGGVQ